MTRLLNNIKDPLAIINETRGKGKGGRGREGLMEEGKKVFKREIAPYLHNLLFLPPALLSDLVNQLILLTDHRDNILAFQKDTDSSLSIILSRVYTDTESDLNHLINTTLIYYDSLNQHNTESLLHSEQSRNASNAVDEYKRLLPQVINIINIVMSNVSEAMDNVDKTDEILENIKVCESVHLVYFDLISLSPSPPQILLQFHYSLLVDITDNINISRSVDGETETVLATARDTANVSALYMYVFNFILILIVYNVYY